MFAHFILHAFFLRNSCYSLITSGVRLFMALPMEVCFLWWYFFNLHNILWEKKVPLRRDANGRQACRLSTSQAELLRLSALCVQGRRLRQQAQADMLQCSIHCAKRVSGLPKARMQEARCCQVFFTANPSSTRGCQCSPRLHPGLRCVFLFNKDANTDCQAPFLQHHFVCFYNTRV